MTEESLVTIAIFVIGLIVQGCAVFVLLSRKLTEVCSAVKHIEGRCDKRTGEHKHHFEALERHGVQLAQHELRISSLEN